MLEVCWQPTNADQLVNTAFSYAMCSRLAAGWHHPNTLCCLLCMHAVLRSPSQCHMDARTAACKQESRNWRAAHRTYDLEGADNVGVMQQSNDIHAALSLDLEVAGSARAHALVPHQRTFAQKLDSIQVHIGAVQHQLHFAEGPLPQRAHNDVLVHKGDALHTAHDELKA